MKTLTEVYVQRGRLLERIALQRAVLSQELEPVQQALAKADLVVAGVNAGVGYVKRHPALAALGVAVLFVLQGRRVLRLARRGFFLWKAWQSLRERILFSGFGLL
jgi:hypothetical protein